MKDHAPVLSQNKKDPSLLNLLKNRESVKMNDDDLTYLHIFRRPSFGEHANKKKYN